MPKAAHRSIALERKLLAHGILQLVLVKSQIVFGQVVLIHQHVIIQILIAGHGMKIKVIGPETDIQCCAEHVTAITRLTGGGRRCRLACSQNEKPVGKTILTGILIIGYVVKGQA